jgi:dTDP-4-amino-4,6-dideoxygalactose transaminase
MKVPFFDVRRLHAVDKAVVEPAVLQVLSEGPWIGGGRVEAFEAAWGGYCGQSHAVGVANGTDAITLALLGSGVGPGDRVIVPALSAFPSVVGVLRSGAEPIFVDVDPGGSLDPDKAGAVALPGVKAILPVHLYGRACDMGSIHALAARHGWAVIEDCAQAHGARSGVGPVGKGSRAAAWSFYPTKNLGASGDAGAISTDEPGLARLLKQMRNYGQTELYQHEVQGINSRLDPIQAAILEKRLRSLDARNQRRVDIGARYDAAWSGHAELELPPMLPWGPGNRHIYPVFLRSPELRERFRADLAAQGIETLIHYPLALCDQAAVPPNPQGWEVPVARRLAQSVVSMPIQPEMDEEQIEHVIDTVASWRPG